MRKYIFLAALFAVIGNIFFYRSFGSLGGVLILLYIFLFELVLLFPKVRTAGLQKIIGVWTLLYLFLLFTLLRVDNFVVYFVQTIGAVSILGVVFYLVSSGSAQFRGMSEFVLFPLRSFFRYMLGAIQFIQVLASKRVWNRYLPAANVLSSTVRPLLIGLILGFPLIFLLLGLLSSGDPIFAHFLASIKFPHIGAELFGRMELTLLVFLLFVPLGFVSVVSEIRHPLSEWKDRNVSREMTVIVLMVVAVLGTFLAVQWPYIFASVALETNLTQFGISTYSEYVRQGFTELLVVVLVVYGVVWSATVGLRMRISKIEHSVLWIAYFALIVLTVIFMISIGRRVYLYQAYHGWSLVRIYGMWLLVWMGMMLGTVVARQYEKIRVSWITVEVFASMAFIIAFGLFNAENFLATSHPPTVNNRVDMVYLSRLSADGVVGWEKSYAFAKHTLVEKQLDQKDTIHMEDRRDIVYSMVIVSNLLEQYRFLVMDYGTDDEKKQFITQVFDDYADFLNERIQRLETVLEVTPQSQFASDKPSPVPSSLAGDRMKSLLEDQIKVKATLLRQMDALEKGTLVSEQLNGMLLSQSHVWAYADGETYYLSQDDADQFHRAYPFTIDEYQAKGIRQKTALDKLYAWNYSRIQAFGAMKNHIPLEQLLKLMQIHYRLFDKISNQPQSERTYQSDISFHTPFVE